MSGSTGGGWFNLPRTSYGSAIERNRALGKRGQRWCPHCKAALPLIEFGASTTRAWCKACQRERQRASRDHRAGLRETEAAIERELAAMTAARLKAVPIAPVVASADASALPRHLAPYAHLGVVAVLTAADEARGVALARAAGPLGTGTLGGYSPLREDRRRAGGAPVQAPGEGEA